MESCEKHPHEPGVALCGRCGAPWCGACLVYSFGPKKPPFCMSCAMFAGGVRSSAPRAAMPRKQLKALMKAQKAEAKASAKAKDGSSDAEPTEPVQTDAALADTDWASPWWEDRQPVAAGD